MGKTLITGLLVVPLIALTGAAVSSWNNLRLYTEYQQHSVQDNNRLLAPYELSLACELQSATVFSREERCSVRDLHSQQVIVAIWHRVQALPWSLQGQFGFAPDAGIGALVSMALPDLLDTERGEWQLGIGQSQARVHYQSGGITAEPAPGTRLQLSPLTVQGHMNVFPPYQTQLHTSLPELQISNQSGGDVRLDGLDIRSTMRMTGDTLLTERLQWAFREVKVAHAGMNLSVRGLSLEQANLTDGRVLSGLTRLSLDAVSVSDRDHDLRVDPSAISLFADRMSWPGYQRLLAHSAEPDALQQFLAAGLTLTLEQLHSSFVYQDRRPFMLGTAGDVNVSGQLRLAAGNPDTLMQEWPTRLQLSLDLDLNRTLMLGPQAELMLDFLQQGWLIEDNDRVRSRIRLQQGSLTANGKPLTALPMPPRYSEDH